MRALRVAALIAAMAAASAGGSQLTSVDVSLGDVSINKVPQLVAADQGLYSKYGLDVHQTISAGAARAAAGSGVIVPRAYVNETPAAAAPIEVGGGSPMIHSVVNNGRPPRVIVLTQEAMAMDDVIAKPSVASVQDLKGKRLGFSGVGSVTHFSALSLAPLAGFKDIGDMAAYKIPMAGSGIMVDKAYLTAHRDTVVRFLEADIEATALMQRDRRVFNAALAKWFNITDAATQNGMFAYVNKFEKKPYPSVDGIKRVFATYDSPQMRRRTPEEFYDSSLIAELDKRGFLDAFTSLAAQNPPQAGPPVRDPLASGFVSATELPDGAVPPANANGNFIIGATHPPSPDMTAKDGVPKGTIHTFTMNSTDSKIYPGIAREAGTRGQVDPNDPAKLIVTTSHPAPYTRQVAVYVPSQYVPGSIAPLIVGADGPDPLLFTALDNLIAQKRVPAMIAVSIANGSGDAQGSERGLEYDTLSGRYAEFVETEVLPLVEKQYNVKLTRNPDSRATMGCSSGAAAALSMAWYRSDLYHRVLSYSGTFVNQQWPYNPETPGGAWEYHRTLIPNSPAKPIRIWMHVSDRDLLLANRTDDMHDWVSANEAMAKVLAAKNYNYQFVFARNAGHCDRAVKMQTLPQALEWVWWGHAVDAKLTR